MNWFSEWLEEAAAGLHAERGLWHRFWRRNPCKECKQQIQFDWTRSREGRP